MTITTAAIWGGIQNESYSFPLTQANGTSGFTWTVSVGALPPGLALDPSSGIIAGTPTASGNYNFTVQLTDAAAQLATKPFNLIISPNDENYGNVGDAYASEGGAPNPNALLLSACQATVLAKNTAYRVIENVSAANSGANCFTLDTGTKLDLGGRTVTGRISMNANPSGTAVFNGTVNCNWPDNGGDAGCIKILSTANPTAEMRIHHLTILNEAQQARGVHVSWPLPSIPSVPSLRLFNLAITVPMQPTALRSFAVSLLTTNHRLEVANSDITCTAEASACQAIMCFTVGDCKLYHNRITMQPYTPATGDVGRALLFDGNTKNGEAWNNLVIANNHRAVRIRDSFNIRVHRNTFKSITAGPHAIAAIHLADPDAGATNDLKTIIENNSIELAGGVVFFIRNGFNATVRNNSYTCVACAGGLLGTIRSPIAPSTRSEILFENNAQVTLHLPAPQLNVFSGATANLCNSGAAGGAGTVNQVGPC